MTLRTLYYFMFRAIDNNRPVHLDHSHATKWEVTKALRENNMATITTEMCFPTLRKTTKYVENSSSCIPKP